MCPFLENITWDYEYTLPLKVSSETFLQYFQFKVINRIINYKYNLDKCKIIKSLICTNCLNNQMYTIEHHLCLCEDSTEFCKTVKKLLQKSLLIKLCFTICEIIFRIHIEHDTIIIFVNYIIILGKCNINNCRMNAKTIQINEFQEIVKRKLKILFAVKPSPEKENV